MTWAMTPVPTRPTRTRRSRRAPARASIAAAQQPRRLGHADAGGHERVLVLDRDDLRLRAAQRAGQPGPPAPGRGPGPAPRRSTASRRRAPASAGRAARSGPGCSAWKTVSLPCTCATRSPSAAATLWPSMPIQKKWLGSRLAAERRAERGHPAERLHVEHARARVQLQADPQPGILRRGEGGQAGPVGRDPLLPLPLVDALQVGQPAARAEVRHLVAGRTARAARQCDHAVDARAARPAGWRRAAPGHAAGPAPRRDAAGYPRRSGRRPAARAGRSRPARPTGPGRWPAGHPRRSADAARSRPRRSPGR